MKTILAVLFTLSLCTATLHAQREQPWKKQFNVDVGAEFPGGATTDALGLTTGFGINGTFYYQLLTRVTFLSLSAGYNSFGVEGSSSTSVTVVPILIGLKYNFTLTGVQPYIGLELGVYNTSVKVNGNTVEGSGGSDFGIMPKFGVRIPLAPQFDLDLVLKYHNVFSDQTFNFIGLDGGVAYTID
jgi:hypothetical protein